MDDEIRQTVERIDPLHWKLPIYKPHLVKILVWSVQHGQQELRDFIVAELNDKIENITEFLTDENFWLLCETLGLDGDEEFMLQQIRILLLDNQTPQDRLDLFKTVMKFKFTPERLLKIEEICIQNLIISQSETFLAAMMEVESLPLEKQSRLLSNSWITLLTKLIAQNNFKLFRMIVADWHNFKIRTNLCIVMADQLNYSDILLSTALDHGRTDMAWLLAGRTWYFCIFKLPHFRKSYLFSMIPELGLVPWESATYNRTFELIKFLKAIQANYPNEVSAQVLVLNSSLCPLDIKEYISDAITNGHVNRVIAAAKSNKLQPEHLHLIHSAGAKFILAYDDIHHYLGPCDIARLHHKSHGPVALVVLGRESMFGRRALRLMNWLISNIGAPTKYMDVLSSLDRIYALDKKEKNVAAELQNISASLATSFLCDPALIADDDAAFELLAFYVDHHYQDFAAELLMRSSMDRILSLFKMAVFSRDLALISPLFNLVLNKTFDYDQVVALCKFYENLVLSESHRGLAHQMFLRVRTSDIVNILFHSIKQNHYNLFKFLIQEKLLAAEEYANLLKLLFEGDRMEMFELLLPIAKHNKVPIPPSIFPSAILSSNIRIIQAILTNGYAVTLDDTLLLTIIHKHNFEMVKLLLNSLSDSSINWAVQDNLLLKLAVSHGEMDLARSLLCFFTVFKLAALSDDTMVSLLGLPKVDVSNDYAARSSHRRYLLSTTAKF